MVLHPDPRAWNQWLSFWEHAEVRPTPLDALEIGRGGGGDQAALERVDQVHALYGALWRRYRRRAAARG